MKYYLSAFQEFAESDQPALMLWPFVSTWTQLAGLYPENSTQRSDWSWTMGILGIAGSELEERVNALDSVSGSCGGDA